MKTELPQKLKNHKHLSTLMIVIGVMLVLFMIITEDEPGAIPLLLILSGAGWYLVTRSRICSIQS